MPSNGHALAIHPLTFLFTAMSAGAAGGAAISVSNVLLRAMSDHATDAISIRDCRGRMLFANMTALRMFGKDAESILGSTNRELYADPLDAAVIDANDQAALSSSAATKNEETLALPVGLRTMASTRMAWRNDCGELLGVVCVSTDITERKRTERMLREHEAQMEDLVEARTADLRTLIGQLETVWDQEKHAIARQLHDDLGSGLTALNLHLAILSRQMPDAAHLIERLAQIKDLMESVTQSARRIQAGMSPIQLDVFGIKTAIAGQACEFQRSAGVTCCTDLPDEELSYPPQINMALFRLLQEALNSIAGQAGVTHVDVVLDDTEDAVVLVVRDNGAGRDDCNSLVAVTHGLRSMRDRTAWLGGDLRISCIPGKGTDVVLTLPKKFRHVAI